MKLRKATNLKHIYKTKGVHMRIKTFTGNEIFNPQCLKIEWTKFVNDNNKF